MSKLVCITKPIEELTEGVNTLEVGHICPDAHKPSPYPGTINMQVDWNELTPEECAEHGTPKYEVDVEVMFNEDGSPSFALRSELKPKADIKADERYGIEVDRKRRERYKKEVDRLVLKKVREQLNDATINAIVAKIKQELPK